MAALVEAGHEVVLVLTQPDRPAGRGLKLQASAVKQFAQNHNIPVAQPRSLRLDGKFPEEAAHGKAAIDKAIADGAEMMIVAAYGLILPQWTLASPKLGCLNIHASLLPRWRGAAPIHRAIEAGDASTGDPGVSLSMLQNRFEPSAPPRAAAPWPPCRARAAPAAPTS